MNVVATTFVDSTTVKQIHLCDIMAGAISAMTRLPEDNDYRTKLFDAGIENVIVDSIWPCEDISPEDLGKRGWDDIKVVEHISEQMAQKDSMQE